jgi:hypothetical protein
MFRLIYVCMHVMCTTFSLLLLVVTHAVIFKMALYTRP